MNTFITTFGGFLLGATIGHFFGWVGVLCLVIGIMWGALVTHLK